VDQERTRRESAWSDAKSQPVAAGQEKAQISSDSQFPRVGLIVVWGPPKCGKSFWVTDAMLHVALGWPYHLRNRI
jgi:hypothetical protein